ncbi:tyrosine-type recombinase/integrase [Cronobacter turicensis]|nr:tyrosine-type recombinase/integrase [Cronobacter turicensis]
MAPPVVVIPRRRLRSPASGLSQCGSKLLRLQNRRYGAKRAGIRRRNPYHTRHAYACWLLNAGANPSFIASQLGHQNAQMVYNVYAAWIEDLNNNQVDELNKKLSL